MTTAAYAGTALSNQTVAPKVTPFAFDALRPAPDAVVAFTGTTSFQAMQDAILAQYAREEVKDHPVLVEKLSFRIADGALTTDPVKGSGLALSRHACNQMGAILFQARFDKPRDFTGNYACRGQVSTGFATRAAMLAEDVARTRRAKAKPVNVRTVLNVIDGKLVRTARAFVSQLHAGTHFDDPALLARLERTVAPDADAVMTRTNDLSYGYATVGAELAGLTRTIHWRNSETGMAGLRVGAGAVLRLVDAVVQFRGSWGETTREEVVTLANQNSNRSIRHTLPGGTPAERAAIANERMDSLIADALDYGQQLEAAWAAALKDVSVSLDVKTLALLGVDAAMEVLLDQVEARHSANSDDRAALKDVLSNDKRLAAVTHGSAAHIAAAFAVLAKRSTSMAEAERLQGIAGQWVVKGWNR